MRDLQECQAEVFRRSEKRIQERTCRRKRIVMTCVPLVLCLVIAGTMMLPGRPSTDMTAPENVQEPGSAAPIDGVSGAGVWDVPDGQVNYGVPYVCVNGDGSENTQFPGVVILRSRQELEAYLEAAETKLNVAGICAKYDDAYFEENCLVFVPLGQGSGSVRHRVTGSAATADGKLAIYIEKEVPESLTCDWVHWNVLVELGKEDVPGDWVQVYVNNSLLIDANAAVWPCYD